jgi:6-phosphofructokinase 1
MTGEFKISSLGECQYEPAVSSGYFVDDSRGVVLDPVIPIVGSRDGLILLEQAGPRDRTFFSSEGCSAAIVTCGGLCPGLNDVIRAIVMVLWYRYGVRRILGGRYGYAGIIPSSPYDPIELTPDAVEDIHQHGGTILGSSRGGQGVPETVDWLAENKISMLFTIGGDGTQRGGLELSEEITKRGLPISVIGIPKTIDNDLSFTDRTFGFETAVAMSQPAILAAHEEAKAIDNGVGLVKLMGRDSGFVAANASLASSDVNLVIVPEVPFTIDGLIEFLKDRLARKSHAVIVAAEGAGQDLVPVEGEDASGNQKLGDIGPFLKKTITERMKAGGTPVKVKYIDPSYTIRSAPADADDSVFCFQLGEHAVHAAMAGKTAMLVSQLNGRFVHVPLRQAISKRKKINPASAFWQSVLDCTGQPSLV